MNTYTITKKPFIPVAKTGEFANPYLIGNVADSTSSGSGTTSNAESITVNELQATDSPDSYKVLIQKSDGSFYFHPNLKAVHSLENKVSLYADAFLGGYTQAKEVALTEQKASGVNTEFNILFAQPVGSNGNYSLYYTSNLNGETNKLTYDSYNGILNAKNIAGDGSRLTNLTWNNISGKPIIPSIEGLASETYVNNKVAALVNSAPSTLDTLNELATALGNDPNFATTVTSQIAGKAPLVHTHTISSITDIANASVASATTANKLNSTALNTGISADTYKILIQKSDGTFYSHPNLKAVHRSDNQVWLYADAFMGGYTLSSEVNLKENKTENYNTEFNILFASPMSAAGAGSVYFTKNLTGETNKLTYDSYNGIMYAKNFSGDGSRLTNLNWNSISGKPSNFITGDNIRSQSVNYASSAGVGNSVKVTDSRNTATTPQTINIGVAFDFKANATEGLSDGGGYFGEMTFRQYGSSTDWSGGKSHQLGFTDNDNIWHRAGSGTTWGTWKKLIDSGNISSQSVNYASSAGNTDTLDGYHYDSFVGHFKYDLDLSGLDQSTYYPVTIPLQTRSTTRLSILVALDSGTVPNWSTHSSGFSVRLIFESNGHGWGICDVNRKILAFDYGHTNVVPVGGVGQMTCSSTEFIYLRGGGKYYLYSTTPVSPVIRTSTYTVSSESVSPMTSAYNNVWSAVGGSGASFSSLYVGSNNVIHSGNIGSQSVNYASSAGSVAWGNISGRPTVVRSTTEPNAASYAEGTIWIQI